MVHFQFVTQWLVKYVLVFNDHVPIASLVLSTHVMNNISSMKSSTLDLDCLMQKNNDFQDLFNFINKFFRFFPNSKDSL